MTNYDKYITPEMMNLKDPYAIKILLAYFLRQIDRPVTPNQLCEIATSNNVLNYFDYTQAVNSMVEGGAILVKNIDGEDYYVLSELGIMGSREFNSYVPKSFRDKILSAGLKFFAKLKNDQFVTVEVTKQERGANVYCECRDSDITLLSVNIFAPDMEQGELLADKIRQNPSSFYSKVIDYALGNEEYKPDLSKYQDKKKI